MDDPGADLALGSMLETFASVLSSTGTAEAVMPVEEAVPAGREIGTCAPWVEFVEPPSETGLTDPAESPEGELFVNPVAMVFGAVLSIG